MTAYTPTFLTGSNKNANVVIKDVSAVLCSIRFNECEDNSIRCLKEKDARDTFMLTGGL
ncbi:hypothetical protein Hdeb2414_s0016g00488851 [Helianthus debilis subsp. tardiflorus]